MKIGINKMESLKNSQIESVVGGLTRPINGGPVNWGDYYGRGTVPLPFSQGGVGRPSYSLYASIPIFS